MKNEVLVSVFVIIPILATLIIGLGELIGNDKNEHEK